MRGEFGMPVLCGGLLIVAGVITAMMPFATGGSSCDGDALAVARRTAAIVPHDADCTHAARRELVFSGGLVVIGLVTGPAAARIATRG